MIVAVIIIFVGVSCFYCGAWWMSARYLTKLRRVEEAFNLSQEEVRLLRELLMTEEQMAAVMNMREEQHRRMATLTQRSGRLML